MNRVFVLDSNRVPLMPCTPARARKLLKGGRAAILRRQPFTIILKDRDGGDVQQGRVKIDPGSKTTGMAYSAFFQDRGWAVVWASNLSHRGGAIRSALDDRRSLRRARRGRKTRYRKPRFMNRTRPEGWLPPSVHHRVATTHTWALRLARWSPVHAVDLEWVRFDTQLLENPNITGEEYQQGALQGYEVREFLLVRHSHTCAYCQGESGDPILEVEHVQPRSRGGSNRLANLVIACRTCNQAKNSHNAGEWAQSLKGSRKKLDKTRAKNAASIHKGARPSLKDAAAVNAARYRLGRDMQNSGLKVAFWSGGRTKHNRTRQGLPKDHWIDAACVGETGEAVAVSASPIEIRCTGHGKRQRCTTDKYGFPKAHKTRTKRSWGIATGDLVAAKVPNGKAAGTHKGRVTIRQRPSFKVNKNEIHPKYIQCLQRGDGYEYKVG